MAKASEIDIDKVQNFFEQLEDMIQGDVDPVDVSDFVRASFPHGGSWERLVHGYRVLLDNVCDPNKSYLDWKPEIQAAMDLEDKWINAVNMDPHLADEQG